MTFAISALIAFSSCNGKDPVKCIAGMFGVDRDSDEVEMQSETSSVCEYEDIPEVGIDRDDRAMPVGMKDGHHTVHGQATYGSRAFGFRIEYDVEDGVISNAEYFNPNYGAKVRLSEAYFIEDQFVFSGMIGSDSMEIRFSGILPYIGTMTAGTKSLPIEMEY